MTVPNSFRSVVTPDESDYRTSGVPELHLSGKRVIRDLGPRDDCQPQSHVAVFLMYSSSFTGVDIERFPPTA
jgi:hypothetical protein